MEDIEFKPWPKMGRINPFKVTISEKMDGTNACIVIRDGEIVGVQSRKRFIKVGDDNYGFAGWVEANKEELLSLGEGHHFGEWAGLGIQKNPHNLDCKKFFLFNTARWNPDNPNLPDCCDVVRVLYSGPLEPDTVPRLLTVMVAEAGDTRPEGLVVYYHSFDRYTKHTIKSPNGKWCKE